MSELPVLEALGGEFRRLGEPRRPRGGVTRRTLTLTLVLTLLLAGVAAAALLITQGTSLPAPNARDLQSSGVPLPASARLAGLDALDPDPAEPPWDIRLSRTRAGETCTAVGQVLGGQFGIVGLDHVFRALPLGGVDACGVDAPDGPVLAGARVFVGSSTQAARTIVNGVAGAGARSVTVYGPEGARALRLGPRGSFIAVYSGYVEEVRPRVVVVTRDGRSHSIAFAQSSAFEVADPDGGSPWEISGGADLGPGAYPDENCAQASQELGRANPSRFGLPMTPGVCGRLGAHPLFVLMRRFVPEPGEHVGTPWGNNPARTLVYGAAARRVLSLTLAGAGAPRRLAIDPHGGVFLAVLDGHVDPRSLTLTARLRDGASVTYRRSTNLLEPPLTPVEGPASTTSRPLREPPVPAYRNPFPARQAQPQPSDIPLAGTVRETLHAKDPAGGSEWALRSWQGLRNPRADFGPGYRPARFICVQVGAVEGHRLVEPRPGAAALPLSVGEEPADGVGGCNAPSDLTRFGPMGEAMSYVADPYAYTPRPLRTVVYGTLRLDATHPLLLGAGAPRSLALDANHAFFAVLPGRYWDTPLRISAVIGGRTVLGRALQSIPGPPSTPQARAPDPNGGAPWGFAAGPDGSSAFGQIVAGRLATIDARTGAVHYGANGWNGGGIPAARGKPPPVRFESHGGPEESLLDRRATALPRPELERRTLPGRTIITGVADADVISVTLATPRDVRTLRPSGPEHVFIVVYDGQFFRGAIIATVALRDGRTVTEAVNNPDSPGPPAAEPPPPSLAKQLQRDRVTLAGMRSLLARAAHANPRKREKLLDGAPLSQIVHGLRDIEAIVVADASRMAYIAAHPGVLPLE
ncbi:MAG TPA: hypothetical protein VGX72_05530 [Solirubrobacteraceae bacterium]|jgi:hypothetical protein|nr:hypothetical protein [Solirubrobacteraceae bacterium]